MELEKVLKSSWDIFQKNIVAYIIGTLIAQILSIFVITIPSLLYGVAHMAAKGARGETVEIKDVFAGFNIDKLVQSWLLVIIFLLIGIVTIPLGSLMLIIPGIVFTIILLLLFTYSCLLMAFKNDNAKDAFVGSIKIIKHNTGNVIVLLLIAIILYSIGVSILWVGTLLTIPFTEVMFAVSIQLPLNEPVANAGLLSSRKNTENQSLLPSLPLLEDETVIVEQKATYKDGTIRHKEPCVFALTNKRFFFIPLKNNLPEAIDLWHVFPRNNWCSLVIKRDKNPYLEVQFNDINTRNATKLHIYDIGTEEVNTLLIELNSLDLR